MSWQPLRGEVVEVEVVERGIPRPRDLEELVDMVGMARLQANTKTQLCSSSLGTCLQMPPRRYMGKGSMVRMGLTGLLGFLE